MAALVVKSSVMNQAETSEAQDRSDYNWRCRFTLGGTLIYLCIYVYVDINDL